MDASVYGDFEMVFQPIVDLHTGHLVQMEALARLRDNSGLLVSVKDAIPAFQSDELFNLFTQGIEQSVTAVDMWEREDVHVGISINCHANALLDRRYLELITCLGEQDRLDLGRLTLELTEDDEIHDYDMTTSAMNDLKNLGVETSLDDLGAGYGSLTRLCHIPFSEVKFDQSLVRSTSVPTRSLHLIYHLSQLAGDIGVRSVVEGLESIDFIEAAAILGVDRGQGYAISKPLAPEAVPTWLEKFEWPIDIANPQTELGTLASLYRSTRSISSTTERRKRAHDFSYLPDGTHVPPALRPASGF